MLLCDKIKLFLIHIAIDITEKTMLFSHKFRFSITTLLNLKSDVSTIYVPNYVFKYSESTGNSNIHYVCFICLTDYASANKWELVPLCLY